MNLHAIASPVISVVNPQVTVSVQFSTGSTTAADYSRVPTFSAPVAMLGQVQPLASGDLRLLDQLNLQGAQKAIYLSGNLQGVIRVSQQGGDLITMPDGTVYLTIQVLEQWPDWVKAAAKLQDGS